MAKEIRHDDSLKHPPSPISKSKLRTLKDAARSKAKEVLNINSSNEEDEVRHASAMQKINEDPAFNSAKFLNRARIGPSGYPDRVISALQTTGEIFTNPKAAITRRAQKKAAGKLARSRPYLSRQADLDFLEAHDDMKRAESSVGSGDDEDTVEQKRDKVGRAQKHIDDLERTRQSMRVAWVTTRHVQRIRVVDVISPPPFPPDSFFEETNDCGATEFQWGKWIGYRLLHHSHNFTAQYVDDFEELPFDFDTLRRHIERLIIVSAPLQTFISEVRGVYRWEDPFRTGRWLATYFVLWYFSQLITFLYGWTIYTAMMNYFYPTSLDDLRNAIKRTIDRGATAFKVGELMDKHGSDDWLGPFLEELGPFIQVEVGDFANFLESTYNFFHWRNPFATLCSLVLCSAIFAISAFTDSRFAGKVFWFVVGMTFFVCWPISSLYPRCRLLVSPFKWAFWDVPTHAEWCFQYLQEQASAAREALLSQADDEECVHTGKENPHIFINDDSDSDESFESAVSVKLDPERDILSFGCTYNSIPGHFIISSNHLRFQSSIGKLHITHETFSYPYTQLAEMSKRQTRSSILSSLAKVTTGMDKLELWFRGEEDGAGMYHFGEEKHAKFVLLENMRGRDKAFNAVIGFSGLKWQCLQKKVDRVKKDGKRDRGNTN